MKKRNYVLFLAAFFMFFAIAACDGKKNKKDENENEDENEEVEDEDEKDDYLTQDLATFDLRGEVIAVKYTGDEHTLPVVVQFEDNGSLKSVYKFNSEGYPEEATIDRDSKRRIEIISFESDEPWITSLIYDNSSMLPKSHMDSNQMGNYTCSTYERDDDGNIVKAEFEEAIHGNIVEDHDEYSVKLSDFDEHGNWQRVTFKHGDYSHFYKRTILYKGDANTFQDDIDKAHEGDPVIQQFIIDMYEHQKYNEYDFLEQHCTPRLLKHLKDQYEYDGEGYAVWLFRTGAQDGKPDVENVRDQVISIAKDNEGWYHYQFTDAGWRGENKLKIFVENGKVMMDQVEKVYDECYETYYNNE